MKQLVRFVLSKDMARLVAAALLVSIPMGIALAWVGASFIVELTQWTFVRALGRVLFPALPIGVTLGIVVNYPLERWVIGDKDNDSAWWASLRLFVYPVFGLLIGGVLQFADSFMRYQYPASVQTSYYVISVSAALLIAAVYTLLEAAAQEIARRENQLKGEIKELRIQIDQIQRSAEVQKVVDSDSFRDLKAQAQALRKSE